MTIIAQSLITEITGSPGAGNGFSPLKLQTLGKDAVESVFNDLSIIAVSPPTVNTDPVYAWPIPGLGGFTVLGSQISGLWSSGTTSPHTDTNYLIGMYCWNTKAATGELRVNSLAKPYMPAHGDDAANRGLLLETTGSLLTGTTTVREITVELANQVEQIQIGSRMGTTAGVFGNTLMKSYEAFFGGWSPANYGPFNMSCGDLDSIFVTTARGYERFFQGYRNVTVDIDENGTGNYDDPVRVEITGSINSDYVTANMHINFVRATQAT